MEDIAKIVNFLEDCGLLLKGVSETIQKSNGRKDHFSVCY